jgi:hypothetical protein
LQWLSSAGWLLLAVLLYHSTDCLEDFDTLVAIRLVSAAPTSVEHVAPVVLQAGCGSILLSEGLLVHDRLLLEPRLAAAAALAAGLAAQ